MKKETKQGLVVAGVVGAIVLGIYATTAKAAPPLPYCCPYCGDCFATLEELQTHVAIAHPGERIPIIVDWTS